MVDFLSEHAFNVSYVLDIKEERKTPTYKVDLTMFLENFAKKYFWWGLFSKKTKL